MLTARSHLDVSGDVGASIIGEFSSSFCVPGTSSFAPHGNNNHFEMPDAFRGFSPSIGNSVTFRPQSDMEIRRKARNTAILAKIQELEANACVQAARSERLKMMREEYESLVRKYAATKRSSNNYSNGSSTGFPPSRYLQPLSSPLPQQHSYVFFKESVSQPGQTTPNSGAHPTRDIPTRINPTVSIGVNTDITGPIKSVRVSRDASRDDLQQLEREKVRVGSVQTDPISIKENVQPSSFQTTQSLQNNDLVRSDVDRNRPPEGNQVKLLSKEEFVIPAKMEMIRTEDDGPSLDAQRRRKQQFEKFEEQLQKEDDCNSISSARSSPVMMESSNNTTEEVRQRQRQLPRESHKDLGRNKRKDEMKDETSLDTVSLAGHRNQGVSLSKKILFMDDASLSDSTFTRKPERKKLMEELVRRNKGKTRKLESEQESKEKSESSEDEEKSVIESGRKQKEDDTRDVSSAGATSESIGDSLMDSIQKTPDITLPHEEAKKAGRILSGSEEINLTEKVSIEENKRANDNDEFDDAIVGGSATAGSMETKSFIPNKNRVGDPFRVQSRVNDKSLEERKMDLKEKAQNSQKYGVKEGQINDAEEFRPNDLSSSTVHVADENQRNFTHANNPGESRTTTFHRENYPDHSSKESLPEEKEQEEKKNPSSSYKDVQYSMDKELLQRESTEKVGESGGVISNEKKKGISLGNMSVDSSSSSFSPESNFNQENNGATNKDDFPPASSILEEKDSTGSGSDCSSRQNSLEEQGTGKRSDLQTIPSSDHNLPEVKANEENVGESGEYHQEEIEEKETPPVVGANADVMPHRFASSSSESFSSRQGAFPIQKKSQSSSEAGNHIETAKVGVSEKGDALSQAKSAPGKKIGNGNSSGSNSSSTRPGSANKTGKVSPGLGGKQSQVTIPTGPIGAKNTARRVRLKLNEDSDTDSSEIGAGKPPGLLVKGNLAGNQGNAVAGQKVDSATSNKNEKKHQEKKFSEDVDDDFDDFYDNF